MTKQTLKNRLKGLARTAMKHEERVAAGLEQDNAAAPPVSWGSADTEGKTIAGSAKDLPENYQPAEHIVYGIEVLRQEGHADTAVDGSKDITTDVATINDIGVLMGVNTDVNTMNEEGGDTKGRMDAGTKPVCVLYGMSEEERLCATLSIQHRAVYEYLLRLPEPWMNTRMADIRNARGQAVPYDSKRGALVWLARAGFIVKRAMRAIAGVKGVAFALAEKPTRCYCRVHALPLPVWLGKEDLLTSIETSVSTSMATQVSTQQKEAVYLKNLFLQHPEYQFWRKSTTLAALEQLATETNLPWEVLDNYLRWYAFSQGQATARGKHTALQQFRACLLADSLHRPEGYQPHEEKMLVLAEQMVREKTERLRRIQRLEEEQARMALSTAFDRMVTRGRHHV